MSPLFQVVNISTLAAWLTMAGASSVACWVKVDYILPERKGIELKLSDDEGLLDLDLEAAGSAPTDIADAEPTEDVPTPEPVAVEPVPEIPEVPKIEPLPEVPDLPEPKPDSLVTEKPKEKPRPQVVKAKTTGSAPRSTSRPATSAANSGAGAGSGAGTAAGTGAGQVGADRFAGGRRPRPNYPSDCRSRGEQGRVSFVLTVDEQGNVVDVRIKSSPYPGLASATESGVRRWKFKPGARGSIQASVTFNLTDAH
ncbi:energy transducer TonB [Luteolibacter ambystomatis]|uniref:Energy transducer TonB n=1 Tax=Luteolibacter ambystomatis TaxID=2824561 RepID=A0A975G6R5_9BACT|nr:energy transducer TonB [Luteolibacter ambystomatis]QUE49820.1 energy transducer TonB [Luteolibacter ambystomatis]